MWKIYKNTGFMVWSGGVNMINSLLVWAVIARYLGPTTFGHFTLIMAIYVVFFNVCSLGLGPFIVREVTGGEEDRQSFIRSVTIILIAGGILSSALMSATGLVLGVAPEVLKPLSLLSLSLIATSLIAKYESLLIARERASVIAGVNTGENVLKALVPWWVVSQGGGLLAVCTAFVILRFGTLVAYRLMVRAGGSFGWPDAREMVRVLKQVPWFLLINLSAGLHWQLGIILLSQWRGAIDVASYGAASRLLTPWTLLCVSYATSVNPTLCRLATDSLTRMGRFCQRAMTDLLLLLLPLAAGTCLLGRPIIELIFGPEYLSAVAPLKILIWTLVPLGLVLLLARSLIAVHKQQIDFWTNVLALGTNFILNVWLIPRYGAAGAAGAQLASVTLLLAIQSMYVSRRLFPVHLVIAGRLALATAMMVGLIIVLGVRALWSAVPVGVISYAGCLFVLGWRPRFTRWDSLGSPSPSAVSHLMRSTGEVER